jgi:DNA primase
VARATNPEQLVALLDRVWPEHPVEKQGEEHMVSCPFCDSSKNKCAVNPKKGVFQCWVCGERGPTLKLLMHLFDLRLIEQTDIDAVRSGSSLINLSSVIQEYKSKKKKENFLWNEQIPCVFPPKTYPISEFRAHNTLEGKLHRAVTKYLKGRGMSEEDIALYRLHFCIAVDSPYYAHIFFPALGEFGKQLVFWTTRSIIPNANPKSLHSSRKYSRFSAKQIMFNQHLISSPMAICEGPFDAFSIMKVTGIPAVPLLGKQLHEFHRNYIESVGVKEVYLCLDPDAKEEQEKAARAFVRQGITPYLVEFEEGDANSIAPEKLYAAFQEAAYKKSNIVTDWCKTV